MPHHDSVWFSFEGERYYSRSVYRSTMSPMTDGPVSIGSYLPLLARSTAYGYMRTLMAKGLAARLGPGTRSGTYALTDLGRRMLAELQTEAA